MGFAHRDMGTRNIMIQTLPQPIKFVYHLTAPMSREVVFYTRYIAKLIDYGKMYTPANAIFYAEMVKHPELCIGRPDEFIYTGRSSELRADLLNTPRIHFDSLDMNKLETSSTMDMDFFMMPLMDIEDAVAPESEFIQILHYMNDELWREFNEKQENGGDDMDTDYDPSIFDKYTIDELLSMKNNIHAATRSYADFMIYVKENTPAIKVNNIYEIYWLLLYLIDKLPTHDFTAHATSTINVLL